jgi:diaminohydroxyphosphoribosylaminopyrimidine deaminase / 5-amino-6-(5-phosphoribosylamino)uracil reductase
MTVARGASPEIRFMRQALKLAQRGYGMTSPNPMVGAVLVKAGKIIGRGFHQRAGHPHAEIEALRDAETRGHSARDATLYVTLEPCWTHGRTPPCTDAIIASGIREVIVGAIDPNPKHSGRGLEVLRAARVKVRDGVLAGEATRLNEAFNHWIVRRTPFVTVKAGMSFDGKIATRTGESKWITGPQSRERAMRLRQGADAILVGANTILRDDPSLTVRVAGISKQLRRIILDSKARSPFSSKVLADDATSSLTTIVVGSDAPAKKVGALERKVQVWHAPLRNGGIDLRWVLKKLGSENITSLLVEGGGEVNASFLLGRFAHRIAFFYAPILIGGADAVKAVAGDGIMDAAKGLKLNDVGWERIGRDLLLTARLERPN